MCWRLLINLQYVFGLAAFKCSFIIPAFIFVQLSQILVGASDSWLIKLVLNGGNVLYIGFGTIQKCFKVKSLY